MFDLIAVGAAAALVMYVVLTRRTRQQCDVSAMIVPADIGDRYLPFTWQLRVGGRVHRYRCWRAQGFVRSEDAAVQRLYAELLR